MEWGREAEENDGGGGIMPYTNDDKIVDLAGIITHLTDRKEWSTLTRDQRGMIRGALLFGSRAIRLDHKEEADSKKRLPET